MERNDGGPAFPKTGAFDSDWQSEHDSENQDGMSLRDWFAGKCRRDWDIQVAALFSGRWAAWLCYRRANAMLAAREKEGA